MQRDPHDIHKLHRRCEAIIRDRPRLRQAILDWLANGPRTREEITIQVVADRLLPADTPTPGIVVANLLKEMRDAGEVSLERHGKGQWTVRKTQEEAR
jgi:hypothetical protein